MFRPCCFFSRAWSIQDVRQICYFLIKQKCAAASAQSPNKYITLAHSIHHTHSMFSPGPYYYYYYYIWSAG